MDICRNSAQRALKYDNLSTKFTKSQGNKIFKERKCKEVSCEPILKPVKSPIPFPTDLFNPKEYLLQVDYGFHCFYPDLNNDANPCDKRQMSLLADRQ